MKAKFYRVQRKTDNEDYRDFDTIEGARKYIEESNVSDETHVLFELKKKSKDVELGFFQKNNVGAIVVKNPNDPTQLYMIGAMANVGGRK